MDVELVGGRLGRGRVGWEGKGTGREGKAMRGTGKGGVQTFQMNKLPVLNRRILDVACPGERDGSREPEVASGDRSANLVPFGNYGRQCGGSPFGVDIFSIERT